MLSADPPKIDKIEPLDLAGNSFVHMPEALPLLVGLGYVEDPKHPGKLVFKRLKQDIARLSQVKVGDEPPITTLRDSVPVSMTT